MIHFMYANYNIFGDNVENIVWVLNKDQVLPTSDAKNHGSASLAEHDQLDLYPKLT